MKQYRLFGRSLAMLVSMATMAAVALVAGTTATATAAPKKDATTDGALSSVVTGTTSGGDQVTGSFVPMTFKHRHGDLTVRGVVNGVVQAADGTSTPFSVVRTLDVQSINGAAPTGKAARAAAAAAGCDVLNLVLGPLDLNLLGLQIHLDKVVLDITAVPGAGNLLGNLLCAVAGLLDGGPLGRVSALLNRILSALGL